jgi:hypothetical protein
MVCIFCTFGSPAVLAQATDSQRVIPFHPVNPLYRSIKAQIDAQVPGHSAVSAPLESLAGFTPVAGPSWQGEGATLFSPSDATGAIGPTEYLEDTNIDVAVYDRTGLLLSSNDQPTWTGFPDAAGDGEVIWSPNDNRFYASQVAFNALTGTGPFRLIYGFSKRSAPTAAPADWCFYESDFGGRYGSVNLPDYPKLGQTADFILIGVNVFDSSTGFTYIGSDVAWVSKPPAGTITLCPSSLKEGTKRVLRNADGTFASTPVPGNQTDSSSTGYVVANEDPGGGTSTVLSVFRVAKNTTTGMAVFSAAKTVTVPAYAYPPSAPQSGTANTLETLDARLTNAVLAPDPRLKSLALWTQHCVAASAGGLGSEVRWYEIRPGAGLLQSGIAQSSSLYTFVGAVSSDRNGTTHMFGSNMVLAFNTSSSSTLPAAAMVSKIGANPQSGFVQVAISSAPDSDFTCSPVCRWGDYSGASPDPSSTTGNVWASVMLSGNGPGNPNWITWNWAAKP